MIGQTKTEKNGTHPKPYIRKMREPESVVRIQALLVNNEKVRIAKSLFFERKKTINAMRNDAPTK